MNHALGMIDAGAPALAALTSTGNLATLTQFLETAIKPMAAIGWIGQALFFSRFLVQWIVSEKEQRSTVPLSFWYLSLGGGVMLLTYAIWRHDPVITTGQSVGLLVYVRNLVLIHRARRHPKAAAPGHV